MAVQVWSEGAAWPNDLVDRFTWAHLGAGFLAGVMGISPPPALLMFLGARGAWLLYKEGAAGVLDPQPGESLAGQIADVSAQLIGLWAGQAVARTRSGSTPQIMGLGGKIIGVPVGTQPAAAKPGMVNLDITNPPMAATQQR